jgi:uncharacterized repeat protein (TIGR02543 family)
MLDEYTIIKTLGANEVDKGDLAGAITIAQGLDSNDYTPTSWSTLTAALSVAETVFADANATQVQVDSALSALETAMGTLILFDAGDPETTTYELATTIETGESYVVVANYNGNNYALTKPASGNTPIGSQVTVSNQQVVDNASFVASTMLWEAALNNGRYYLQNSGYLTRNGNNVQIDQTASPSNSRYSEWIYDNANHRLYITSAGSSTSYYLTYNGSFAMSNDNTSAAAIYLYKLTTVSSTVPVITIGTQPAPSTNVTQGSVTGSLSVAASVTEGAALSYQWYSNTTNSNTGGTAVPAGGTSASLAIPTSLTQGTYYYYCTVSATGGATPVTSSVATVVVAPASGGQTTYELATTIQAGEKYVIVARSGANNYALTTAVSGNNMVGQQVTLTGGDQYVDASGISPATLETMLWSFATPSGGTGYNVVNTTAANGTRYLNRTSGTNALAMATSASSPNANWTYTYASGGSRLGGNSSQQGTSYDLFYSGTFQASTTTNAVIYLYKVVEGGTPPTTYTVTFDSAGGSVVMPQTVVAGTTATEPTSPERSGYTFVGWNLGGSPYSFTTPVTGSITLVAQWTENPPTGTVYSLVNTITSAKQYVIVANVGGVNYALTSTVSGSNLAGGAVTVSGSQVVDNASFNAATMLWTITSIGGGEYSVRAGTGGNYLNRVSGTPGNLNTVASVAANSE